MRARVLTALAGIPLVLGILLMDSLWLFAAFVEILVLIALLEYFRMAFPDHRRARAAGVAAGMLL